MSTDEPQRPRPRGFEEKTGPAAFLDRLRQRDPADEAESPAAAQAHTETASPYLTGQATMDDPRVPQLQAELAAAREDAVIARQEADALAAQLVATQDQVNGAQTQAATAQHELNAMREQQIGANDKSRALEDQLRNTYEKIGMAEAALATARLRIETLEGELKARPVTSPQDLARIAELEGLLGAAQSRVIDLEAESQQNKDQTLRALAEAENTRRRAERDREDTSKFAITSFARNLLSVADNFRRALRAAGDEMRADPNVANLLVGIEATERELIAAFERAGIRRIPALGLPFNANFHEVMFEIPSPSVQPGTVLQVVEEGYTIHDRLLRPARVGVSKADGSGGALPPMPIDNPTAPATSTPPAEAAPASSTSPFAGFAQQPQAGGIGKHQVDEEV